MINKKYLSHSVGMAFSIEIIGRIKIQNMMPARKNSNKPVALTGLYACASEALPPSRKGRTG